MVIYRTDKVNTRLGLINSLKSESALAVGLV